MIDRKRRPNESPPPSNGAEERSAQGPHPSSGATSDAVASPIPRIPKKKRIEEDEENQDDIFLIDDGDEANNREHEGQQQPPTQSFHVDHGATSEEELPDCAAQQMASYRFSGSGELKLPEGVELPPTITPELMSDRLREMLFQLPVELMKDAFREYDTAVTLKGVSIRSHQAYLHGVLKRYVLLIEKERESLSNKAMGKELTQEVKVSYCYLVT